MRARAATRRGWSRQPARSDPHQQDRQQLGHEVAAREDDVERDQESDREPRRATPPCGRDARPAARPEHEDEGERRHADAQDLDRQTRKLRPGAGDVTGKERKTDAQDRRCDQGESEDGEAADHPWPQGDRLRGSVVALGRRLGWLRLSDPPERESIARRHGQGECEDRTRDVGRRPEPAIDRKSRRPDPEEDRGEREPPECWVPDVEPGPLGGRADQDCRSDERGDHEDDDPDAHPGVDSSVWGVDPARAALAALAASLA